VLIEDNKTVNLLKTGKAPDLDQQVDERSLPSVSESGGQVVREDGRAPAFQVGSREFEQWTS